MNGFRRGVLGLPVALTLAATVTAGFFGSPVAAVAAGAGAAASAGAALVALRPAPAPGGDIVRKAARHAAAGRKLVIYERETGLFAHWYLKLRGEEECDRAARYGRPFTLCLVEPTAEADPLETQRRLANWFRTQVRHTDVVGYVGHGRFLALLPETDRNAAQTMTARLVADNARTECALSVFGEDGVRFDDLYARAQRCLSGLETHAA